MKLQDLVQMKSFDRENALWEYLTGKIKQDDVEDISLMIGQLRKTPERASKVAKRIAEVFDNMTAEEFSKWWLEDGAYK